MELSPEELIERDVLIEKKFLLEDPQLRLSLISYARRLCFRAGFSASDVDDLVQNTYLRATKHMKRFQLNDDLSTRSWFYKILYSVFCDTARKKRNEQVWQMIHLKNVSQVEVTHERSIESELEELSGSLKSALDTLDDRYFVAFWLVVVEGVPQNALATQMGTTRGNVAKLVFRSKEVLRRVLKDIRK